MQRRLKLWKHNGLFLHGTAAKILNQAANLECATASVNTPPTAAACLPWEVVDLQLNPPD
jgi:hypothetical protein